MILDVAFIDMKPRFSQDEKSHYERCSLFPKVVIEHDENKTRVQLMSDREIGSSYAFTLYLSFICSKFKGTLMQI